MKPFLITLSSFLLVSCSMVILSPRAPTDLHLESVLSMPFNKARVFYIPKYESSLYFGGPPPDYRKMEVPKRLIQVNISSNENLAEFFASHEDEGYEVLSCNTWRKFEQYNQNRHREGRLLRTGPRANLGNNYSYEIELNGVPVNGRNALERFHELPKEMQSRRPFLYQIYFDLKNNPYNNERNGAPSSTYDLEKTPEDMCLQIFGGGMYRDDSASNVVVIPKEVIISALKNQRSN